LARVVETYDEERRLYGTQPGFINALFQALLALCAVLSLHHVLRSAFPKYRYFVGDLYVVAWLLIVVATASCALGGAFQACLEPAHYMTPIVVAYRLIEILSRELWVILYRKKPITSFPRVLSVAIVNYAMATGLFGYLYGTGEKGFEQAAVISLAFTPLEPITTRLELVQGGYCLAFLIVVLAVFIAQATLPGHGARAAAEPASSAKRPAPVAGPEREKQAEIVGPKPVATAAGSRSPEAPRAAPAQEGPAPDGTRPAGGEQPFAKKP
jgi:hypothetical protein